MVKNCYLVVSKVIEYCKGERKEETLPHANNRLLSVFDCGGRVSHCCYYCNIIIIQYISNHKTKTPLTGVTFAPRSRARDTRWPIIYRCECQSIQTKGSNTILNCAIEEDHRCICCYVKELCINLSVGGFFTHFFSASCCIYVAVSLQCSKRSFDKKTGINN